MPPISPTDPNWMARRMPREPTPPNEIIEPVLQRPPINGVSASLRSPAPVLAVEELQSVEYVQPLTQKIGRPTAQRTTRPAGQPQQSLPLRPQMPVGTSAAPAHQSQHPSAHGPRLSEYQQPESVPSYPKQDHRRTSERSSRSSGKRDMLQAQSTDPSCLSAKERQVVPPENMMPMSSTDPNWMARRTPRDLTPPEEIMEPVLQRPPMNSDSASLRSLELVLAIEELQPIEDVQCATQKIVRPTAQRTRPAGQPQQSLPLRPQHLVEYVQSSTQKIARPTVQRTTEPAGQPQQCLPLRPQIPVGTSAAPTHQSQHPSAHGPKPSGHQQPQSVPSHPRSNGTREILQAKTGTFAPPPQNGQKPPLSGQLQPQIKTQPVIQQAQSGRGHPSQMALAGQRGNNPHPSQLQHPQCVVPGNQHPEDASITSIRSNKSSDLINSTHTPGRDPRQTKPVQNDQEPKPGLNKDASKRSIARDPRRMKKVQIDHDPRRVGLKKDASIRSMSRDPRKMKQVLKDQEPSPGLKKDASIRSMSRDPRQTKPVRNDQEHGPGLKEDASKRSMSRDPRQMKTVQNDQEPRSGLKEDASIRSMSRDPRQMKPVQNDRGPPGLNKDRQDTGPVSGKPSASRQHQHLQQIPRNAGTKNETSDMKFYSGVAQREDEMLLRVDHKRTHPLPFLAKAEQHSPWKLGVEEVADEKSPPERPVRDLPGRNPLPKNARHESGVPMFMSHDTMENGRCVSPYSEKDDKEMDLHEIATRLMDYDEEQRDTERIYDPLRSGRFHPVASTPDIRQDRLSLSGHAGGETRSTIWNTTY